ncbi:MAG: AraC family transcriptional regulator [Clostridia bacterium]|nr:AraC family transcriptional regulator [Clostridia bacterium]
MDWISGIQKSLDYIENHITEELNYEAIAKEAACSNFYFQRIFSILCGISIGEYIRCRRLTLAGNELCKTNKKVIDIAFEYGYESPESFSRAFLKFHGVTPSEAKKDGSKLKSFSPLSVQIILRGGSIMDYKIVDKPAFTVLEKVEHHSVDDSQNKNSIPDFWTRSHKDGTVKTLLELADDKTYIFGICYNTPKDNKYFEYSIAAVYTNRKIIPKGFRINEIPARTWAVFETTGAMPNAIQDLFHKILSEFFPTSAYQPTYEMDIEAYTAGNMSSPCYKSEIWIPVIKTK